MTDILANPPAPPERNRLIEPSDIHFISKEHALVNFWAGNLGSLNIHILDGGKPTIVNLTPSQFETLAHWMQERVGATR